MTYAEQIKDYATKIIEGKIKPETILNSQDFFYIQNEILRRGNTEVVKKMGLIARSRNLKRGIDILSVSPYK